MKELQRLIYYPCMNERLDGDSDERISAEELSGYDLLLGVHLGTLHGKAMGPPELLRPIRLFTESFHNYGQKNFQTVKN